MLPVVAGLFMGSLNKQASATGMLSALSGEGSSSNLGGLLGGLTSILDSDQDGSIADDVADLAKKFL